MNTSASGMPTTAVASQMVVTKLQFQTLKSSLRAQVRVATPEEISEADIAGYVFGGNAEVPTSEDRSRVEDMLRYSDSWNIAAFSSTTGSAVAQLVSMPWKMAPGASGAAELAIGAVTMVGTLPEYRRRGFLRTFMTQLFAELRRTGQPVAGLWASMAAIYQRYGYSECTAVQTYTVDTVDIKFHDMDGGSCVVSRQPMAAAMPQLELLYREWSCGRVCAPSWETRARLWTPGQGPSVEEGWGGPTSTSNVAVATDAHTGAPRGYVVYKFESGDTDWKHRTRFQQLTIGEMICLDADAYRSLWSFVARHDLVGRVKRIAAPIDDPATELFLEVRFCSLCGDAISMETD
jgi:GNAT superfamily N-acetyltransferase